MTIEGELEAIRNRNGGILRPRDVVKAAANPESPLHSKFTWNDSAAAQNWRLEQARCLIRVAVNIVKSKDGEVVSRMFVAISSDKTDGGGYRVLADVLSDENMRTVLLQDALNDMQIFEKKYANLMEIATVIAAMREVGSGTQVRQAGNGRDRLGTSGKGRPGTASRGMDRLGMV